MTDPQVDTYEVWLGIPETDWDQKGMRDAKLCNTEQEARSQFAQVGPDSVGHLLRCVMAVEEVTPIGETAGERNARTLALLHDAVRDTHCEHCRYESSRPGRVLVAYCAKCAGLIIRVVTEVLLDHPRDLIVDKVTLLEDAQHGPDCAADCECRK